MKKYRLTCVATRFIPEETGVKNLAERQFKAKNDERAIQIVERPTKPLAIVVPGEGAVPTVPRELVELCKPPRIVKQW